MKPPKTPKKGLQTKTRHNSERKTSTSDRTTKEQDELEKEIRKMRQKADEKGFLLVRTKREAKRRRWSVPSPKDQEKEYLSSEKSEED